MRELSIGVVGAGIGGLQTALALAKDDHDVVVFESAKEFLEVCSAQSLRTLLICVGRSWDPCTSKLITSESLMGG